MCGSLLDFSNPGLGRTSWWKEGGAELFYDWDHNSLENNLAFLQRSGCRLMKHYIIGYAPAHFLETTMAPLGIPRRPRPLFKLSLKRPTNRDDGSIFFIQPCNPARWTRRLVCSGRPVPVPSREDPVNSYYQPSHEITIVGLLEGEKWEEHYLLAWIIEASTLKKTTC